MKKVSLFIVSILAVSPVFAEVNNARGTNTAQWMAAPRVSSKVASQSQIAGLSASKSSIRYEEVTASVPVVDKREDEKNACLANNIGVGNTFVWASKNSNTSDYSTMIEDTDNYENNVCFVKVGLGSLDSRINLTDIAPVYFQMGQTITCGSWVNKDNIKNRILDAKKSSRTWGTIAGAVGGAGVGVGAMELFGNKLIGGSVEGQKGYKEDNKNVWITSELLELKNKNITEYNSLVASIITLKQECDKIKGNKPKECTDSLIEGENIDINMMFNNIPA